MGEVTEAKFQWPILGSQRGGVGSENHLLMNMQSADLVNNAVCMHPCTAVIQKYVNAVAV